MLKIMLTASIILSLVLSIEVRANQDEPHCIWYGVCKEDFRGRKSNCAYDGPGKPIENKESQEILQRICPELYTNPSDLLCCDNEMIQIMNAGLKKARFAFGGCETCMRNMQKSICAMNCSPKQSDFLTPIFNETAPDGNNITKKYVASIEFEMSEDYVESVYNSCSRTTFMFGLAWAIDFACGSYDSDTCTAKRWYNFMGDPVENSYVPFPINYKYTNSTKAFRAETKKCNEAYPNSTPCLCRDCQLSCAAGERPNTEAPKDDDD